MARSGGEAEETIYGGDLAENVAVLAEPHLLAPEAYDGCFNPNPNPNPNPSPNP